MPSVKFSKEDFLGKAPMTPGWYTFSVGDFTEKPSKDGDSTNFWGEFKVISDGDFKGTEIRHCFNEKALQFAGGAADYMACFTKEPTQLADTEVIDSLRMTSGRKVQGYVQWNPDFRKNEIKDWRASND